MTFVACDLASLDSVKEAAQQIMDTVPRLDVLICNAGIMDVPAALTKDGYEIQFGTNHMGHALLMRLLLPSVQRANGRIVGLTSLGFSLAPRGGIQFDTLKTRRDSGFNASWTNYGQSKLANLLYVRAMAKRFPEVTIVAIHPGVVKTDLVGKLSFWSRVLVNITSPFSQLEPQQGAYNQVWAASTSQADLHTGNFYEPVGETGTENANTQNAELANELWDWTEKELKPYLG